MPHPCEVPGSIFQISKLSLKEDHRPVQGSVGHRVSDMGPWLRARRMLVLKANQNLTLGNSVGPRAV